MAEKTIDVKIRAATENDAALKALRAQEETLKAVAASAKKAGLDVSGLEAELRAASAAAGKRELDVQISVLEKLAQRAHLAGKETAELQRNLALLRGASGGAKPPPLPEPPKGFGSRLRSGVASAVGSIPVVGPFLREMNGAAGVLTAVTAGGLMAAAAINRLAHAFVDGVMGAADYAGRMSDISARTGQSVQDVIVLGQAFRNAGMGQEMVGQSLNLLQKALTGVNEEGQPTAGVFERLGLSIDGLRQMSAVDQMRAIGAAISGLKDPAAQSRAAMEMFGRSGGQMLAVLKDAGAFDTARQQVGALAENLGAAAADLDKFSDAAGSLDVKQMQFFAGFAAGVSGDLASAADAMNRMDFSGPGKALGEMAAGAAELAKNLAAAADKLGGLKPSGGAVAALAPAAKEFVKQLPGGQLATNIIGGAAYLQEKGQERNREARARKNLEILERAATPEQPEPLPAPELVPENVMRSAEVASAVALRKERNTVVPEEVFDAAEKGHAADSAAAAKREELELELAIAEARQRGDEGAEAQLKWQKDYNQMLAEGKAAGMTPDEAAGFATRGANAGAEKPAAPERDVFSAMRAIGGARGENYSIQNEALKEARATNQKLDKLLAKEPVKIDTTGRWA